MTRDYKVIVEKYIDSIENPDQQKMMNKYVTYCMTDAKGHDDRKKGQSMRTIHSKVVSIIPLCELHDKPFIDFTRDDIEDYIYSDAFRLSRKVGKDGKRKEVTQSSMELYKVNIRTFFKWVHYNKDRHMMKKPVYPDVVDWMEITNITKETTPDELFTEQEVLDMIESRDLLRDRLYIALLFDTGGRLAEILDLTENKIIPDSYGFTIVVDGKTGPRSIRLFMSVPYLKAYMQTPQRGRYLIRTKHGRMSDTRAEAIVKEAAKAAGVERNAYPHLFRHTTSTRLASELTEPELRVYAGWKKNSVMPGHYVHLSGTRIDNKMLGIYGLKKDDEEEKTSILAPVTCPRCQEINGATQSFCVKCGMDLRAKIPLKPESEVIRDEMRIRDIQFEVMQRQMAEMQARMDEQARIRQYERENTPDLTQEQQQKRRDEAVRLQSVIAGVLAGEIKYVPTEEEIATLKMAPPSAERDKVLREMQEAVA